jgi:hypothetical protein
MTSISSHTVPVPLDEFDKLVALLGINLANVTMEDLDIETRYKLAIAAVRTRETPAHAAAIEFCVPRSTLGTRLKGAVSRKEAHESQKALTTAQEVVLVEWIKASSHSLSNYGLANCYHEVMGKRGLPLSLETVGHYGADIAGHALGETWARRFKVNYASTTYFEGR